MIYGSFFFSFFGLEHVILAIFLRALIELLLLILVDLRVIFFGLVAAVVVAGAIVEVRIIKCQICIVVSYLILRPDAESIRAIHELA